MQTQACLVQKNASMEGQRDAPDTSSLPTVNRPPSLEQESDDVLSRTKFFYTVYQRSQCAVLKHTLSLPPAAQLTLLIDGAHRLLELFVFQVDAQTVQGRLQLIQM